jgi:hypothetical protein
MAHNSQYREQQPIGCNMTGIPYVLLASRKLLEVWASLHKKQKFTFGNFITCMLLLDLNAGRESFILFHDEQRLTPSEPRHGELRSRRDENH